MWWCAITLMMIHHHICDDYLCKCDDNHHNCDDTHNICDDMPSHLWWYAITLMMMCHHKCDDNHYICDDCRQIGDDSHHKCDDLQHICDDPQHICEDLQHIYVYRIQGVTMMLWRTTLDHWQAVKSLIRSRIRELNMFRLLNLWNMLSVGWMMPTRCCIVIME